MSTPDMSNPDMSNTEHGDPVEVFQDPVTGTYWRADGRPGFACPQCGNGYATAETANDPDAHGCEGEDEDASDGDEAVVFGQNVAYPNGRCMACGFGLADNGACTNTGCSNYDRDADPYPPTCLLTGEPGEDPEDCTTHGHEDDSAEGRLLSAMEADTNEEMEEHLLAATEAQTEARTAAPGLDASTALAILRDLAARGSADVEPDDMEERLLRICDVFRQFDAATVGADPDLDEYLRPEGEPLDPQSNPFTEPGTEPEDAEHPDTDEGTLVIRATDDPDYDEAAAQEQQRPGGESMYGVYARFIQPVGPGQDKFAAIEAVDALVADLDGVDAVWSEGRVATNWDAEAQAEVADPEKTYLIIARFIEVATDADAAAEAVRARLAARHLTVDEVLTAAEYEN